MYDYHLYKNLNRILIGQIDPVGADGLFHTRFLANAANIWSLYGQIYRHHSNCEESFNQLIQTIINGYKNRSPVLRQRDLIKSEEGDWFLSNKLAGMSLYVDRFCGNISTLGSKLEYLEKLGLNFLHLMPLFESPENESDGGYAVSNFRKIDDRFGTIEDLQIVRESMGRKNIYLMLDIVLNHTSRQHAWAQKARGGDSYYQNYFYFFNDRSLPDEFDKTMPEIFPESAPGNFTYVPECNKWVMTVFHSYQWDLNYSNPQVFVEMLDTIFFYANLGVDLLRIDAPAFIWKQLGTTCQNLDQAHILLQLIKQCVQVSTPGMAILGEAIVAPKEIIKYFGTGQFKAHECDFAYNATHMALQWDALATGDIRVMMAAQDEILKKPLGTSWITYTRSHDDIGLGYEDYMIEQATWNAYQHRIFLKNYFSGVFPGSTSRGALFSANSKTGDARISGTLASLCGLEKALGEKDQVAIDLAIKKILMMQAQSFFIGGLPMLFYGDESGHTNDYSYLNDVTKNYDNRWMHRPLIDWKKIKKTEKAGSPEHRIFSGIQKLLQIRKKLTVLADRNNLTWMTPPSNHVAAFIRTDKRHILYCLFNFSGKTEYVSWHFLKSQKSGQLRLYDHWKETYYTVGENSEYLILEPYSFCLMELEKM